MKRLGLTGSIGMGKTTTAALFAECGVPVFDADAEVHQLYELGGEAVDAIADLFPGVVENGRVDRQALSRALQAEPASLPKLNAIVHRHIAARREKWIKEQALQGAEIVLFDVPLLFETGLHRDMDAVVVVSAPASVQRARVLARPGMTDAKFRFILSQQWPDAKKCALADFVVDTGLGVSSARRQVRDVLKRIGET
ncbi:MAG: dephospho-CoA kinase [Maricaulaceae bacterium]